MTAQTSPLPSLAERLRPVHVIVRSDLEVTRQLFHAGPAYVVRDPVTFHTHHFTATDYRVFVALDPDEELHAIFTRLCQQGVLTEDQEEEFYRFVLQLTRVGLLVLPLNNAKTLHERSNRRRLTRKGWLSRFLFFRIPLFHPDPFLERTQAWVRPLFTRTALLMWCCGLIASLIVIAANWDEFRSPLAEMLTLGNLPLLWSLVLGLKVIHEFGHAYACKRFGGEVPEMGAYFILFSPCAYVDASSSWGFANRWHRVLVGLGGIYFESLAAMAATLVWALTEPGRIHAAAQYTIVLSTIMTVGFNANPLMRYDGYFILSDLLAMPSLRGDAQRQIASELKWWLFGIRRPELDQPLPRRLWLAGFGLASSLYRLTVLFGLTLLIAFKVPIAGVGLALAFALSTVFQFVRNVFRYVLFSPEVASVSRRARWVTAAMAAAAVWAFGWLPVPNATTVRGTLRREHERTVYSRTSGFLQPCSLVEGTRIRAGQVVCRLENVDVTAAIQQKDAEIAQLRLRLYRELLHAPHLAVLTRQQIARESEERQQLLVRARELTVRAPTSGIVTAASAVRQPGSYVRQGQAVARIVSGRWIVSTVVHASQLADLRPRVGQRVIVRLRCGETEPLIGRITQLGAGGSRRIDAPELTQLGGGDILVTTDGQRRADRPYYTITVLIEDEAPESLRSGMTALLRLEGSPVPLRLLLYRRGLYYLQRIRMAAR